MAHCLLGSILMKYLSQETAVLIAELDAAIEAHMGWTRRVMRCAVLRTSPGDDVLDPLAHTLCRFGCWFMQNRTIFEKINIQSTGLLDNAHQAMHRAIRSICIDVLAGQTGLVENLGEFEQTQQELIKFMSEFKTQIIANSVQRDYLTGLPMRHEIDSDFTTTKSMSMRDQSLLYVILIDVDHFKKINDTHGHAVGDLALQHLVTILKKTKRLSEPLFRFGGEEFLMLMRSESLGGITHAIERFIEAVRSSPITISPELTVTMTITVGLSRVKHDDDLTQVIARADKALYDGKKAGRDRYVVDVDS